MSCGQAGHGTETGGGDTEAPCGRGLSPGIWRICRGRGQAELHFPWTLGKGPGTVGLEGLRGLAGLRDLVEMKPQGPHLNFLPGC